jgi:hypothetical protein
MRASLMKGAIVAAALSVGAAGLGPSARAADLQLKAPPPPPTPWVLDVHGFFDVSFKNDYITPRGLLVTNTGLTTQILNGLSLDIYKDKNGLINDFSIYGGMWNDLWSKQNDPHVGSWNEFDWFIGANVVFAQNWKIGVQYIEFLPPAHDLITSFPSIERNVEFSLSYNDAWLGWPISFHPYAKLFYAASGPSTVVLGKGGNTYDVELGVVPTLDMKKYTGVPLVITAPTWVTVGPTSYWNRNDGTTAFCGPTSSLACPLSNTGVVSTGLTGKLALDSVIPKRLGNWYVDAGFQYYHILNDALLAAQIFTGAAGGASNVLGSFPASHQDVVVGFAGFGFDF